MGSTNAELKQEISQMKKRIASLEKAFDSILTKDDARAIQEAHRDLAQGEVVPLSQVKKKRSLPMRSASPREPTES
jgi:cell division septum initiation protein DivIVA